MESIEKRVAKVESIIENSQKLSSFKKENCFNFQNKEGFIYKFTGWKYGIKKFRDENPKRFWTSESFVYKTEEYEIEFYLEGKNYLNF